MNLIYCRLETTDNNTKDFNFESLTKINQKDYNLVFKSYLYMIYYFSTSEMSNQDLDFFDLYSPPFVKAVFIFKINDKFLKLNYSDLPLSYQLSNFYPETGTSDIISSQAREIYNTLTNDFQIETWSNYKLIYNLFTPEVEEEEESLSISSYGDEYSNDYQSDENSLSLGSSSVSYEEEKDVQTSQNNFDGLSIKEKRELLGKYKKDLKEALEIKEIKQSILGLNVKLKYYSKIKKEIENFNIVIKEKEDKRKEFTDIHWMSANLFTEMSSFTIKKKNHENKIISYQNSLEKNAKDIASIKPDNIFKNKIVIPTFLLAIITFVLSWVMREDFWYLSGASILFFTVSFYFLWGYIDYLEYIIKLRREKSFYDKKIIKEKKKFEEKFGNLERTLRKEKVEDINIPIKRFQDLKEFDLELENFREKQQMFIVQNFSSEAQSEFESLIKQKEDLNQNLKEFKNLELNHKELEFDIIELKTSIKEYEKNELNEFSLDDDPEEIDENPENDELTLDLSSTNIQEYEFKYELNKFKEYFIEIKEYLKQYKEDIYDKIKKDFLDIVDFSIHYNFSLEIDFEEENFIFSSEKEMNWTKEDESRFKFFLQYSLIKYLSKNRPSPIFLNIPEISRNFGIHFASFLDELSSSQIIYMD